MKVPILCVDDDPSLLASLQRTLRNQFQIVTATSGKEGLQKLSETSFAVVVSDLRMPGMDGIEFLSRVRAQSPDTIRIMLTGNVDLQAALDAINESNIFRLLTKPVSPANMEMALRAGVEQYDLVMARYELDQMKSRFDVNIAFKLRTAMTRFTLLLYQLEQGRREDTQLHLDKLKRESVGVAQIATDLVAISYMDLKNSRTDFVPMDLNALVDQVVQLCTEGTDLQLNMDLAADLPLILGEESPGRMVITGLLLTILSQSPTDMLQIRTYASDGKVNLQIVARPHESKRIPSRLFSYGIQKEISQLNRLAGGMEWKLIREVVARYGGDIVIEDSFNLGVSVWFPSVPVVLASVSTEDLVMHDGGS